MLFYCYLIINVTRLHDMRSPADCEAVISDPTDDPAIFSLLMIGRERVIAGTAHHSLLKIFDLRRCSGGRTYSYLNLHSDTGHQVWTSSRQAIVRTSSESHPRVMNQSGSNIFATPHVSHHTQHVRMKVTRQSIPCRLLPPRRTRSS